MDKQPDKVVYLHNGQCKVSLFNGERLKWWTMTPDEIQADFDKGLEQGDPVMIRMNNAFCDLIDSYTRQLTAAAKE
ncbi:hypothetical protein [Gorillibacterium sp. sgz5001074]|uniref:hypothetical protein n=1 Tax=Gorillibacterium sp. sgz5001074 TaxID=3446695 RepID=UPI003F666B94